MQTDRLLLVTTEDGFSLLAEQPPRQSVTIYAGPRTNETLEHIGELVRERRLDRPQPLYGLRVAAAYCLRRTFRFPANVAAKLDQILALELTRTTPFDGSNVYSAHHWRPNGDGNIGVEELVIRKDILDPIIADAERVGGSVMFADAFNPETGEVLPIDFLAGSRSEKRRGGATRVAVTASVVAACLLIAAPIQYALRQDAALGDLHSQVADARKSAKAVQDAVSAAREASLHDAELQARRAARASLSHVWQELTALLPDTVWVSELRISGETGQLSGFATSAASLVALISRSLEPAPAAASPTWSAAPYTARSAECRQCGSSRPS